MSFKLRDNMNLKELAKDKLDMSGRIVNIEVIGIDKDTLWVLVQVSAMEQKSFNTVQEDKLTFAEETRQKTFGG